MRALLDTHALLWWQFDEPRLSARVRQLMADQASEIVVSSVTGFEIATKHRLGKLWTGNLDPSTLPDVLEKQRISVLPISLEHALVGGALPGPHRDPFDRLLIAQSRVEGLPMVTRDPVFKEYKVPVIW